MDNAARLWSRSNRYMILQRLIRSTMSFPNAQFKVLLFIYDRTIQFRKLEESIPYSHFRNGVFHRQTGQMIQPGTGLGEDSLKRAIRGLLRKGIIRRRRNPLPFGTIYSIETRWWHADLGPMYEILHPEEFPPYSQRGLASDYNLPVDQVDNQPFYGWSPDEKPPTNKVRIKKEEIDRTETARHTSGGLSLSNSTSFKVRPPPKHIAATRTAPEN